LTTIFDTSGNLSHELEVFIDSNTIEEILRYISQILRDEEVEMTGKNI